MKLTVSRETFLSRLGIAVRAASTRSAIQTLAGVLIRVDENGAELLATDMELGLRVTLEPRSDARPGRRARPAPPRRRPLAAEGRPDARVPERPAGRGGHLRPGKFHLRTLPPEDFPKLPDAPAEGMLSVPDRGVRGHHHARGPGGVARRDAPAPHRRAGHRQRQRAPDGGHGLVSPRREGDQAREAAGRVAGGERAGADPSGARPDRDGGRVRRRWAWPRSRTR